MEHVVAIFLSSPRKPDKETANSRRKPRIHLLLSPSLCLEVWFARDRIGRVSAGPIHSQLRKPNSAEDPEIDIFDAIFVLMCEDETADFV